MFEYVWWWLFLFIRNEDTWMFLSAVHSLRCFTCEGDDCKVETECPASANYCKTAASGKWWDKCRTTEKYMWITVAILTSEVAIKSDKKIKKGNVLKSNLIDSIHLFFQLILCPAHVRSSVHLRSTSTAAVKTYVVNHIS